MSAALKLAHEALYITSPNPRVGCMLVNAQGLVIGQGHTQRAGEAHAEIMALRDAQAQQHNAQGATAYVTLEPCSHQGRTGPCCDALMTAGVSRVVVAVQDPNPLVSGQGIARLRAAGVQVDVGLCENESRELNIGFFKRMTQGLPWVRLKVAASLDGQTALASNGVSQWITSAPARHDGHAWRARACAVLTGIGTVLRRRPATQCASRAHCASPLWWWSTAARNASGRQAVPNPAKGVDLLRQRQRREASRLRGQRRTASCVCPMTRAKSTCVPCCKRLGSKAASTKCMWKRATNSMALSCSKGNWWTRCWLTSRRSFNGPRAWHDKWGPLKHTQTFGYPKCHPCRFTK